MKCPHCDKEVTYLKGIREGVTDETFPDDKKSMMIELIVIPCPKCDKILAILKK